ncbi:pyridoxamine 5'-phosphate oxidase family protein [Spirochaeta thermophila]|uniref:Pyridoxamine 5'-phosphate oxidase N-terminal domain-containing protein n=1 Tax=Winmispira thermophila (strain ATCC 49972 / DSM 6192 / RI 19.B1) TaxID=665571 RepID=E0RQC2_WINT6|nr:pyridoxamine 5'-phosphate oxidase family protein [Spirochaeta thermophila]ADN02898.1 hypothetical protein STHERM_c19630 [Spirochaeta thermophila DSM 6192]
MIVKREEILTRLEEVVDTTRFGLLVTVGESQVPNARWMTAGFLKGQHRDLYTVSSPHDRKVKEVRTNPEVLWVFSRKDYREVFRVWGRAQVIENPALLGELLEGIAEALELFWKVHGELKEFVVIETVITRLEYERPREGVREVVSWE